MTTLLTPDSRLILNKYKYKSESESERAARKKMIETRVRYKHTVGTPLTPKRRRRGDDQKRLSKNKGATKTEELIKQLRRVN